MGNLRLTENEKTESVGPMRDQRDQRPTNMTFSVWENAKPENTGLKNAGVENAGLESVGPPISPRDLNGKNTTPKTLM